MEPLWASLTMTVAGIFSSFSKILLKNGCLKNRYKKVVISANFQKIRAQNIFFLSHFPDPNIELISINFKFNLPIKILRLTQRND